MFVELTRVDGRKLLINTDHVVCVVTDTRYNGTIETIGYTVHLTNGQGVSVHEDLRMFTQPKAPTELTGMSAVCGAHLFQDEVGPNAPRCALKKGHSGFCDSLSYERRH